MFEKEAEEKYCKGCILRIEQCLWAWRNTNGLNEPSEKNCSCKEVPAYIAGAEFGYNKGKEDVKTTILKLRNCMNCKHRDTRGYSSCKDKGIVLCSHWEMKE